VLLGTPCVSAAPPAHFLGLLDLPNAAAVSFGYGVVASTTLPVVVSTSKSPLTSTEAIPESMRSPVLEVNFSTLGLPLMNSGASSPTYSSTRAPLQFTMILIPLIRSLIGLPFRRVSHERCSAMSSGAMMQPPPPHSKATDVMVPSPAAPKMPPGFQISPLPRASHSMAGIFSGMNEKPPFSTTSSGVAPAMDDVMYQCGSLACAAVAGPDLESIELRGDPISSRNGWALRRRFVEPLMVASMCEIARRQRRDRTSLGVFRPRRVIDLEIQKAMQRG
jgi:hypothetical protein